MRRVVAAASITVGLATVIVGGTWLWRWIDQSSATPPAFASVPAIESRFKPQVDRLIALAESEELQRKANWGNNPEDLALFSQPAILEVALSQPGSNSSRILADRNYSYESRLSKGKVDPVLGQAVVNQYWDTAAGGKKLTVAEYRRSLRDKTGNIRDALLLFDLGELAHGRP